MLGCSRPNTELDPAEIPTYLVPSVWIAATPIATMDGASSRPIYVERSPTPLLFGSVPIASHRIEVSSEMGTKYVLEL